MHFGIGNKSVGHTKSTFGAGLAVALTASIGLLSSVGASFAAADLGEMSSVDLAPHIKLQPCYGIKYDYSVPKTTVLTGGIKLAQDMAGNIHDPLQAGATALADYKVVVLLDSSHSMATCDCPHQSGKQNISRWQWCENQASLLKARLGQNDQQVFKLVSFDDKSHGFGDIGLDALARFFYDHKPSGTTNIAQALGQELDQYFDERARGIDKPLLIAVITDGKPSYTARLKETIARASARMQNKDEIKLTFLQVGQDSSGSKLLQSLAQDLSKNSLQYDMVRYKPFDEVMDKGLLNALKESITDEQIAYK